MKKKILLFTLLLALLVGCATLAGCKKVKEIVLDRESLTLNLGDVTIVEATISPEKAKDTPIHWVSSNTAVVTVENGKITAVGVGSATVTATADKASATLSVTVVDPTVYVTGVTLSDTTLDLPMGEIETLTASVLPANATNAAVKWESSDPAVVRVHNGTLTPVSVGTATVTVTTLDGGKRASCAINVYDPPVLTTGISLNRETATLAPNTTLTLRYTLSPDNPTNAAVIWSVADPTVATVENGTITAVGIGVTTVTVTTVDTGKSDSCVVNVVPVYVQQIVVVPESLDLLVGESSIVSAVVTPAFATDKSLVWSSSDEGVATVVNGTVCAIAPGTATVTVKNEASGVATTIAVTVTDPTIYVTGVTLSEESIRLVPGAEQTVVATVTPTDATDPTVVWTVADPTIATVVDGKITAVAYGTTTVTVTTVDGGYSASVTVTVYDPTIYVTGVTLSEESIRLVPGAEQTVVATVTPTDATDSTVVWTVADPTIATVVDGKITAVAYGATTVTVTTVDGGHSASVTVTVYDPTIYVTGVTLSARSVKLLLGDAINVTATVTPTNATNPSVLWTVADPTIATVVDGKITAVAYGTTTVTVTTVDGGFTDTISVTVYDPTVYVENVILNTNLATVTIGNTLTLIATVSPDNADTKDVAWSVTDPAILRIENGIVSAIGVGTADVIVTTVDGGKTARCTVIVEPIMVEEITVNRNTLEMIIGDTVTLNAKVTPNNATDPTLVWLSSDTSVVTVKNGNVVAIGEGTATITVKNEISGVFATVTITVNKPTVHVNGVMVSKETLSLAPGMCETVTATVRPDDATDSSVVWTVADPSIASVADGMIMALKIGTTTVTVTTVDGGYSATISLTVYDPTIYVERVELSVDRTQIELDESATLTATVYPENADNKTISWSSSDESVLTVQDGVITPVGVGTATVTVTTEDGAKTATVTITVLPFQIEKISLPFFSRVVAVGTEFFVSATYSPNNATDPTLIWSSSDTSVVTVEDGKVVAVGVGEATVKVRALVGNAYATLTVCVVAEQKPSYSVNPDGVTATVTGLGTVTDSEIVIPDTIDGYVVTAIDADAFFGATITSLTLPNTVVEIGSNAFYGCMRLSSVTLGTSLRTIREGAFRGCIELYSITLPASLASIETDAFYGCRKLVEVYDLTTDLAVTRASTDNGSVGRYAHAIHRTAASASILSVRDGFVVMSVTGGRYLLGYVGSSVALVLPDTIEQESYEIYHDAFIGRSDIISVTLTRGVTAIGTNAFRDCTSLTEITLYPELLSIGEDAFLGCYALATVYDLTDHLLVGKNSDNGSVGRYADVIYNTI